MKLVFASHLISRTWKIGTKKRNKFLKILHRYIHTHTVYKIARKRNKIKIFFEIFPRIFPIMTSKFAYLAGFASL